MIKESKGQFYLMGAVIIIALILGYVAVSNLSKKQSLYGIDSAGEELEIESQKVLDYIAYNNLNSAETKNILVNFTKLYSNYSQAENLYFVFGNTNEVSVSAYRKSSPGEIMVNYSSGGDILEISKQEYINKSYTSVNNINLTINEITHEFELKSGENFYFVLSQGDEEKGEYIFTGSAISEDK